MGAMYCSGAESDAVADTMIVYSMAPKRSSVSATPATALLVDDGVDGDGRLAGLAVANDQLALTAADRHHRVDCENARLHRLMHRLAADDARSLELDRAHALGLDRALAVDRHAQRVDDAAEQTLARRHVHNATSGVNLVVFLDCGDIAEKNGADFIFLEVLDQTVNGLAALTDEFQQLTGHRALEAVDTCNTVADLDDRPDLTRVNTHLEVRQLLAQGLVDGLSGDFSH